MSTATSDSALEALRRGLEMPMGTDAEVSVQGLDFRVRRGIRPGVPVQVDPVRVPPHRGAVPSVTLFDAAERRPDGYPPDLPFLPGHSTVFTAAAAPSGVLRHLAWEEVADARAVVDRLAEESVAQGWRAEERSASPAFAPFGFVRLSRGGTVRVVGGSFTPGAASVFLTEQPA